MIDRPAAPDKATHDANGNLLVVPAVGMGPAVALAASALVVVAFLGTSLHPLHQATPVVGEDRRSRSLEVPARDRFYASLRTLRGRGVEILYPPGLSSARAARALLGRREACAKRMAVRLAELTGTRRKSRSEHEPRDGDDENPGPVPFVLFPNLQSKMMIAGSCEEAGPARFHPELVPLFQNEGEGLEDLAHARALARALLGKPTPAAPSNSRGWIGSDAWGLEWGIAVHLNGSWKGTSAAALSARLAAAKVLPALGRILDPPDASTPPLSPLILGPAAGSFVEFAVSRVGAARFMIAARSEDPARALRHSLETSLSGRDGASATGPGDSAERAWLASLPRPSGPAVRKLTRDFQNGVCLAHTNSPETGYGGETLGATLDHLASLGVRWISVTPFGFQRQRSSTRIGYVLGGAGSETDEVMRRAIREAHARGLKVLYKPHLWVGHGDWSGEIEMESDGDWTTWFAAYRELIVHHALLAEEEKADLLSVANELAKTAVRAREWRQTIAALRSVYGGPLTYAANWGEEVEAVTFWDALDAVGVNCYYPLTSDPQADDGALLKGAQDVAERLARIGQRASRPVLLTEIGFASRPECWTQPHREIEDAPPDLDCQARAYDVALRTFSRDPFLGLYWWKYESDPAYGGPRDSSFTPKGKPAERILAEAYGRSSPKGSGGSTHGAKVHPAFQ